MNCYVISENAGPSFFAANVPPEVLPTGTLRKRPLAAGLELESTAEFFIYFYVDL